MELWWSDWKIERTYVFDVGGERKAFITGKGPHLTGGGSNDSDGTDQR